MEEKQNQQKNDKKRSGYKTLLEFVAFVSLACIALALMFAAIFEGKSEIYTAFKTIGDALAYILTMVLAGFFVARKKGQIGWLIAYIVFVVVIIVLYIVTLV